MLQCGVVALETRDNLKCLGIGPQKEGMEGPPKKEGVVVGGGPCNKS